MKPLAPNITLQDRYKITEMIGKGGMGEVYLAIDQRLGHSIALKRTTVGDDILLTEAFEREARTLAQLRHSVLPKVSDHFFENDQQFLIMEYISGEDLSNRIKATNKAFPLNWVMFWADQLLDALTYLHTYNPPIIHRDIKPQNLKLTGENNIVLLDFGLSKNALAQTQVTSSGSVVGYTPHYASMEQIRGTGTNARSDIFSLSATIYHLLANSCPVDALTRADAMLSGIADPLKPLTELNPEINETISNAILKGMELSQEKRFNSAREMQKTLRRAYNQMQKSMAEQTVEFNAQGIGLDSEVNNSTGLKTEVMTDLPSQVGEVSVNDGANEIVQQTETNEYTADATLVGGYRPDDTSAEKTEVIDAEDFKAIVGERDLNATVQVKDLNNDISAEDSSAVTVEDIQNVEISNKQTIETSETDRDIPADPPVATVDNNKTQNLSYGESEFKTHDDFAGADYKTSDDVPVKDSSKPPATVPIISLEDGTVENQQYEESLENVGEADWDKSLVSEEIPENKTEDNNFDATAGAVGLTNNFSADATDYSIAKESSKDLHDGFESKAEKVSSVATSNSSIANTPPTRKKSSTGKYIAILGGLGAFLILMIGGAFGAVYYYTDGTFNFNKDNSATTRTEPETQPSVESNPIVEEESTDPTLVDKTETTEDQDDPTETETTDDESESTETETTTEPNTTSPDKSTTKKPVSSTKTQTTKKPVRSTTKKRTTTTKTKPPKTKPPKPPITKPKNKKKDAGVL